MLLYNIHQLVDLPSLNVTRANENFRGGGGGNKDIGYTFKNAEHTNILLHNLYHSDGLIPLDHRI